MSIKKAIWEINSRVPSKGKNNFQKSPKDHLFYFPNSLSPVWWKSDLTNTDFQIPMEAFLPS